MHHQHPSARAPTHTPCLTLLPTLPRCPHTHSHTATLRRTLLCLSTTALKQRATQSPSWMARSCPPAARCPCSSQPSSQTRPRSSARGRQLVPSAAVCHRPCPLVAVVRAAAAALAVPARHTGRASRVMRAPSTAAACLLLLATAAALAPAVPTSLGPRWAAAAQDSAPTALACTHSTPRAPAHRGHLCTLPPPSSRPATPAAAACWAVAGRWGDQGQHWQAAVGHSATAAVTAAWQAVSESWLVRSRLSVCVLALRFYLSYACVRGEAGCLASAAALEPSALWRLDCPLASQGGGGLPLQQCLST